MQGHRACAGAGRTLVLTLEDRWKLRGIAMDRLTRYLMRQFALSGAIVALVLTLIVLLPQSLRLFEFALERGVPLPALFEMTVLLAPSLLAYLLPIGLFAGVLFTLNKLTGDRELVVMRAAGASQLYLARPALLLALLVALFCYVITLYVSPTSYRGYKDLRLFYRNSFANVLLREGRFTSPLEGVTVYVRTRQSNGDLRGILVHDARVRQLPVTWLAESGAVIAGEAGTQVVMFNGNRQEVNPASGQLTLVYFERGVLDLDFLEQSLAIRGYDATERYLDELLFPEAAIAGGRRNALIVEGLRRLSLPLLSFGYVLIALGALLTGDLNRRGQGWRVFAAIGLVALLQIADLASASLATRTPSLRPLACAAPPLAAALGATWLLYRPRGWLAYLGRLRWRTSGAAS